MSNERSSDGEKARDAKNRRASRRGQPQPPAGLRNIDWSKFDWSKEGGLSEAELSELFGEFRAQRLSPPPATGQRAPRESQPKLPPDLPKLPQLPPDLSKLLKDARPADPSTPPATGRRGSRGSQPEPPAGLPDIDWSKVFLKNLPDASAAHENSPRDRNSSAPRWPELLQQFSDVPDAKAPAVRPVSLARCHVTAIQERGNIERFLREERKVYPNNSLLATLTKEISVSHSVTRTVTLDKENLRALNGGAGATLIGFGGIQAQVARQISQRLSVSTESSLTISETTTIQIPPASTVEHIIRWMLVSDSGVAVLGETPRFSPAFNVAEVPYTLPVRLTYTEILNDIPQVQKRR